MSEMLCHLGRGTPSKSEGACTHAHRHCKGIRARARVRASEARFREGARCVPPHVPLHPPRAVVQFSPLAVRLPYDLPLRE